MADRGIPNLKVISLNVSWEASNFDVSQPQHSNATIHPKVTQTSSFRDAYQAFTEPKYDDDVVSRAYKKSIMEIHKQNPHIILLQEYQDFSFGGKNSIDVITNLGYTLCAKATTTTRPPACCLVLVKSSWLKNYADVTRQVYDTRPSREYQKFPFDVPTDARRGRPIAVASVTLENPHVGGEHRYVIVSSHSEHKNKNHWKRFGWEDYSVPMKSVLEDLHSRMALVLNPPPNNLVWGGDFNSRLSIAKCKWGTRSVHKISRKNQRTATLLRSVGSKGFCVDWIFGTSTRNTNGHTEVKPAASDHRMVEYVISAPFQDM